MILCLRDEIDAAQDVAYLTSFGIGAVAASVMQIQTHEIDLPDISKCQGLIYTSRYAIQSAHTMLSAQAYCVGAGSARAAQIAGFQDVIAGDAGADRLAEIISNSLSPDDGAFYWPHGAIVQMDMVASLRKDGFRVFEDILYELKPIEIVPAPVASAADCAAITAVMCFSAQHLHQLARLLEAAGLWHHHENWALIVPSARVANAVPARWDSLHIAEVPSHQAMLDAAKTYAQKTKL